MDPVVFVGSLSPAAFGVFALLCATLAAPIALALILERFVYEGEAADPVGFAEFEDRFSGGETWTDRLRERED